MNELETGLKVRWNLTMPVFCLIFFLFTTQLLSALHYAYGLQPSAAFEIFYQVGFFLSVAWWFKEDCKKHKIGWVLDMGYFLWGAWFLIIPFYLFKTRGLRAFITIFSFIGIYLGTYLISLVIYFIVLELNRN